jgi:hypothetical protein
MGASKSTIKNYPEASPLILQRIKRVAYINIDSRTDRLLNIKNSLKLLQISDYKIHRIRATVCEPPYKGCTNSHIRALQFLLVTVTDGWVGVFEDDFQIANVERLYDVCKTIEKSFQEFSNMRVLMLAVNPFRVQKTKIEGVNHVQWGLSSSGYAVHTSYIATLIQSLKDSMDANIPLDVFWQETQKDGAWYCLSPPLGIQMPGYSDITQRYMDYKM